MSIENKIPDIEIDTSEISSFTPEKIRVLVGVTGSIDSLVAAFLLKKQGFQVMALAVSTWNTGTKDREGIQAPKCFIQDLDNLKAVCESMDISFYASDARTRFDLEVLEIFLANKLTGMSNISCMDCTSMRFHILSEKMKKLKCHFLATGHYAKTYKNHQSGEYFVHSANETAYDQSTLLAGLPQEILRKTLLPLSELKKEEAQTIANSFGLNKKESSTDSGMCFKSDPNIGDLITRRVPKGLLGAGHLLESLSDKYIGEQGGLFNFELGDKHIKDIQGKKVDLKKEQEITKFNYREKAVYIGNKRLNFYKGTQAINVKFSAEMDRSRPAKVFCKINNNIDYFEGIIFYKNNSTLYIEFKEAQYLVSESDKIVFYDKNTKSAKVLGHGFIGTRGEYEKIDRTKELKSDKKDFTGLNSNRKGGVERDEEEIGF